MFESELLTQGFSTLLNNPQALLFATFGVMLGIVIGALPGLTATMGVAILLPFTYGMEPVSGLLMICGVFFGGVYGGSITAILLKIPGTPAAAATAALISARNAASSAYSLLVTPIVSVLSSHCAVASS